MSRFVPLALTLTFALPTLPAAAQMSFGHAKVAAVSTSVSPTAVTRGSKGTFLITLTIAPGYHVNAHKLTDPDLIPTDLTPNGVPGVTFGPAHFPAAKQEPVAGKRAPVYIGRTVISVPFTVTKAARPGPLPLSATLTYQGCNATACFPPVTAAVKSTISVR